MKLVIQRVDEAKVTVDEAIIGRISKGLLILVGVSDTDTTDIADKMLDKALKMRIFDDENGVMNKSILEDGGEILVISQFTLHASTKKGNRPSFTKAGAPAMAESLVEYFIEECKKEIPVVELGEFGADMKVELLNDGPFTVILDSDEIC